MNFKQPLKKMGLVGVGMIVISGLNIAHALCNYPSSCV